MIPRQVHGDTMRPEHQLPSRKSSVYREGSMDPLVALVTLLDVAHGRRKNFIIDLQRIAIAIAFAIAFTLC